MIVDSVRPTERMIRRHDRFTFSCHSELTCFNRCCRSKDLPLTPYDVLRLKRCLGLDSDTFLDRHTLYRLDPGSGFPVLSLRLMESRDRLCPFVSEAGCRVYEDRPTACRLFPLGRSSAREPSGPGRDELFFLMEAPVCEGLREQKGWTVDEWVDAQGLGPYVEMNDRMLEIVFHPNRDRTRLLDDGQVRQVIVACYNLDVFRDFVFRSRILDAFGIDSGTRSRIRLDDRELLELGIAYLRETLFL